MLFSPQRLVELIEYTDRLRTSNREIPFWQIRDWSQKYLQRYRAEIFQGVSGADAPWF